MKLIAEFRVRLDHVSNIHNRVCKYHRDHSIVVCHHLRNGSKIAVSIFWDFQTKDKLYNVIGTFLPLG